MIAAALLFLKGLSWQTYAFVALGLGVFGICGYVEHLRHEVVSVTAERDGLQASIKAAQKLATDTATSERVAQKEIANESQRLASRARSDAVIAVGSHERLLDRAATVASAGPAASASEGSSTASGPGLVLADVLGRIDDAAGQLASALDQARIAGIACERSYDALTPKSAP